MNTSVSGRESLNGAAEPGRDPLEIDVFEGTKSVRAKNRCNASRLETADRTFINFLKLFGPPSTPSRGADFTPTYGWRSRSPAPLGSRSRKCFSTRIFEGLGQLMHSKRQPNRSASKAKNKVNDQSQPGQKATTVKPTRKQSR
jgi:hypothetical protein